MLLDIDWLYLHRTEVNYYDKAIECVDENGEVRVLQGTKKATSIRMVTSMRENRSHKKGCVLVTVHIYSDKGRKLRMQMFLEGTEFYNNFRIYFLRTFTRQLFGPCMGIMSLL